MVLSTAEYRVAFDITKDARPDTLVESWLICFVFLGIGILLAVFRKKLPPGIRVIFPSLFLAFPIFALGALLFGNQLEPSELASAYRAGRCQVIEGVVTQFHPMPAGGHGTESFVVAGKRFEYSDYCLTAGFNKTSSHGGPLREGIRVRIYYLGDDIAKLEIADDLNI